MMNQEVIMTKDKLKQEFLRIALNNTDAEEAHAKLEKLDNILRRYFENENEIHESSLIFILSELIPVNLK